MLNKIREVFLEKEGYPPLLKEIPGAPQKIYYTGNIPEENEKIIAIVGTRKATNSGKGIASRIAYNLAEKGFVIVSGLALGIDAAAHEGALKAEGRTIAVLGNGLNKVYPAQNCHLAKKTVKTGGALISEYEPSAPSMPHQFLERNRIISGLSQAVLIVEAPLRSGALSTANHAGEQGREVFVVPGPAEHTNYEGSHKLIRDGARLVSSAEDILEDMGFDNLENQRLNLTDINDEEKEIVDFIKQNPETTVDFISDNTGKPVEKINSTLGALLIKNVIVENNNKFSLDKKYD